MEHCWQIKQREKRKRKNRRHRHITLKKMRSASMGTNPRFFDTQKLYSLSLSQGYRTPWTTLRAQFDLERDVQVKLRTMLRGKCTNGIESTSAALELVWHPKLTGIWFTCSLCGSPLPCVTHLWVCDSPVRCALQWDSLILRVMAHTWKLRWWYTLFIRL